VRNAAHAKASCERSMKALHWSDLREMRECPAAYKYRLEHGAKVTDAMNRSTLVHAALFGPGPYQGPLVWDGNKVKERKRWAAFKEDNEGREIVTIADVEKATAIAAAVLADPVAAPLVTSGTMEETIRWKVGDRECEGTPDNIIDGIQVDLKVCSATNPEHFPWHCKKFGWHGQQAFYADSGVWELAGAKIISVPPAPPFCPVVYSLTPETLRAGTLLWRSLFERLVVCEQSDSWPGYAQQQVPLELPDAPLELVMDGGEVVTM